VCGTMCAQTKETLAVEMDMSDEYRSYFEETWPKALNKLKKYQKCRDGQNHKELGGQRKAYRGLGHMPTAHSITV
jgi:hypothetical protein